MKYLTVPGLLLTSIVIILLLWSDRSNWTDTGRFYQLITNNRATSQIFVQVISQCLGAVHVHVLCTLINFATRLRLTKRPTALDQLKFRSALCGVRLDWSLPLRSLLPLMIFAAMVLLPGALWAGALTPVVTSTYLVSRPSPAHSKWPDLSVPRYSSASERYWQNITWLRPQPSIRNEKGVFTYSPNYDLQGRILNLAASASSRDNSTRKHDKIDDSQISYMGRSFGVGSSVGLVDGLLNSSSTLSYNNTETGYRAKVECIMNSTSLWNLRTVETAEDLTYPNIYSASGTHASGAFDNYVACGLRGSGDIVVLAGQAYKRQNLFSIAAGKNYDYLNGMQCNVTFSPTNFSVNVNLTQRTIAVTPLPPHMPVKDINPDGGLINITMRMLTSFSQQNACNLYTSIIGSTFQSNIKNLNASRKATPNASRINNTAINLQGVEDSLNSMLDNVLLAYSSAQLMVAHDYYQVPTTALVLSVRVGEPKYIYSISTINFLVVLLFLLEAIRTKGWNGLKKFDFMDIKSVVIGTSMGGTAIANAVRRAYAPDHGRWDGSAADSVAGKMAVRVDDHDENLALVFDGKKQVWSSGKYEALGQAEDISRASL